MAQQPRKDTPTPPPAKAKDTPNLDPKPPQGGSGTLSPPPKDAYAREQDKKLQPGLNLKTGENYLLLTSAYPVCWLGTVVAGVEDVTVLMPAVFVGNVGNLSVALEKGTVLAYQPCPADVPMSLAAGYIVGCTPWVHTLPALPDAENPPPPA